MSGIVNDSKPYHETMKNIIIIAMRKSAHAYIIFPRTITPARKCPRDNVHFFGKHT